MAKSLKFRMTIIVLITSLLVGAVMMFFLNHIYQRRIDIEYGNKVTALANIVALTLDAETIDRYYSTLEKDGEYERILEYLRIQQREHGVAYIVISKIDAEGETILFDTDTDEEGHIELGVYFLHLDENDPMPDDFMNNILPMILIGEKIEPYISEFWGGLLKTITHIKRDDGSIAASVSVSVFMDDIMRERMEMLVLVGLLITAIVVVSIIISLFVIKKYAETKHREEILSDSNEILHSLNQMKSKYLANMSHDMKMPLTVISVLVQQAAELYEECNGDNPTINGSLKQAHDEIMRVARMTETALSLASMQESREQMTRFDITGLLSNSAEAYRAVIEKQGNTLNYIIALNPIFIFGSADRLIQVMANLLTNANTHTKNGKITVEAELSTEGVTVTVTDNGAGIPPELLPRVFERGVTGSGGTGVGLEICKSIIESHRGTIWLESDVSKGTKVTFILPVCNEERTGEENA